jgi:hypothetical protein
MMRSTVPLSIALAAAITWCAPTLAHADPPPPLPAPPPPAPPPPRPSGVTTGWAVAAVSVVLGASITGLSLVASCTPDQRDCARLSSYALWSGVGLASIGSVVGLLMVRAATPPPRVHVSVGVDPTHGAPSSPHASFVYTF